MVIRVLFSGLITFSTLSAIAQSQLSVALKFREDLKTTVVDCAFNGVQVISGCTFDLGNHSYQPFLPATLVPLFKDAPEILPQPKAPISGCRAKQVASVKIGEIDVHAKWVFPCATAAGLGNIGLTFLEGGIWQLDLEKGSLTKLSSLPSGLKAQKLYRRAGKFDLGIEARIGGVPLIASLDTGSGWSYFDRHFVSQNKNSFGPSSPDDEVGDNAVYNLHADVLIGDAVLKPAAALVTSFRSDPQFGNLAKSGWSAIFGMDILRHHVWYLDLRNNRWAIEN